MKCIQHVSFCFHIAQDSNHGVEELVVDHVHKILNDTADAQQAQEEPDEQMVSWCV
jgi:hypothetical protein